MFVESNESGFLTTFSAIAEEQAIKELKGKEFEFGEDTFSGKVRAVDPERHLNVEILEFNLTGDVLELELKTQGRLDVTGKLN